MDNTNNIVVNGIKTKERVKNFGEVFTPEHIVKDMCDLVDNAIAEEDGITQEKILRKTWLEPACGTGNFLVEILDRKIKLAMQISQEQQDKLAENMFIAVSTIYGIDIQKDNVEESKIRMRQIIDNSGVKLDDNVVKSLNYVIDRNIHWGNALTGMKMKTNTEESLENMMFSEWKVENNSVNRVETHLGEDNIIEKYEPIAIDSLYTQADKVTKQTIEADSYGGWGEDAF